MPDLLATAIEEYEQLKLQVEELRFKMDVLYKTIIAYGGEVQRESEDSIQMRDNMSWKARVLNALTLIGEPASVKEIVRKIKDTGTYTPDNLLQKSITLYTSRMAKNGEINVDNSKRPFKYSLP